MSLLKVWALRGPCEAYASSGEPGACGPPRTVPLAGRTPWPPASSLLWLHGQGSEPGPGDQEACSAGGGWPQSWTGGPGWSQESMVTTVPVACLGPARVILLGSENAHYTAERLRLASWLWWEGPDPGVQVL